MTRKGALWAALIVLGGGAGVGCGGRVLQSGDETHFESCRTDIDCQGAGPGYRCASGTCSASDAGVGGSAGFDGTSGSTGVNSGGAGGTAGQGAGGTASCGTNGKCPSGTKCCLTSSGADTHCVAPEPAVGCSLTADCARCPDPPLNANAVCNGDQCGFQCLPSYVPSTDGTRCDPVGIGGQGGTGGAPACDPKQCPGLYGSGPGCSIASPVACCTTNNTCGCTYSLQTYCF